MPQPTFDDIRRFCEIDGWDEKKSARGKTGDHYRYTKTLADGRILRTRASHGGAEIGDRSLWRRIWRDQLGLDSEDQFWEALRTGEPVDRSSSEPETPAGETIPAWLVTQLVLTAGVPEHEVLQMSADEAHARWQEFCSRPRAAD